MNREERYVVVGAHTVKDVLDYDYLSLKDCCKVLNQQNQQIKDIETKLAESESKVAVGRFWHSAYEGKQLDYDKLNNDYNKQEKLLSEVLANASKLQFEFDQLKQQLTEKERELHYKNCESEKWKRDYENCSRLEKTISKEHQYCLDNWRASEQNKISFAVEKLEKVKHYAKHIQGGLIDYIDKQIEELKKEIK